MEIVVQLGFSSDINTYSDKILSAVIKADSFFYGIFDKDHTLCHSGTVDLQNIKSDIAILSRLHKENVLYQSYEKVSISYTGNKHNHIAPADLSDDLLTLLFEPTEGEHIKWEKFTAQDVVAGYTIEHPWKSALDAFFDNYHYRHLSTAFSYYMYPSERIRVLAHFNKDTLHLMTYKGETFLFYNHFTCKEKLDYLYFILLIFKVCDLDTNKHELQLSGKIDDHSELIKSIKKYVANVQFLKPGLMKMKTPNPLLKKHYYFDLYATALCVL